MKYTKVGDIIFVVVRKYDGKNGFKSINIIEATVSKVGTKFIYVKHDIMLETAHAPSPKLSKKTGIDYGRSTYIKRRAFKTKKAAETWILDTKVIIWSRLLSSLLRNKSFTIEQCEQVAEILGVKEPQFF